MLVPGDVIKFKRKSKYGVVFSNPYDSFFGDSLGGDFVSDIGIRTVAIVLGVLSCKNNKHIHGPRCGTRVCLLNESWVGWVFASNIANDYRILNKQVRRNGRQHATATT